MAKLSDWCSLAAQVINSHELAVYTGEQSKLPKGCDALAKAVPIHYATRGRVAHILKKLGKKKAAQYILGKLPTSKSLRSGDLGEIAASLYGASQAGFSLAIYRFRWKDHREMAMRGEDMIALADPPKGKRLRFLKGEAKSRVSLNTATISDAREALRKNGGRPSPHALSFLSDRLFEDGNTDLSDRVTRAMLADGIRLNEVEHLVFTFSGNDPTNFLKKDLEKYGGQISQHAIGLRVEEHGRFVKDVFSKVIDDADNG